MVKHLAILFQIRVLKIIGVILIWWQIHESHMHITSNIARKMLCIFILAIFQYRLQNRQIYQLYDISSNHTSVHVGAELRINQHILYTDTNKQKLTEKLMDVYE